MNETETRLRQLSDLSREKSLVLPPAETAETLRLLRDLLAGEDATAKVGLLVELSPHLPPEIAAQALGEAWSSLGEASRTEIVEWQRKSVVQKPFSLRRLTLALTRGLLKAEPLVARQLLAAVCRAMTANDTQEPAVGDAHTFRATLIGDPGWTLAGLDLTVMPSMEKGPLVRCAFTAAFVQGRAKKPLPPEVQVRAARWLLTDPYRQWLTPARQEVLLRAASNWPPAAREEIAGLVAGLPALQQKLAHPVESPAAPSASESTPTDIVKTAPPSESEPSTSAETTPAAGPTSSILSALTSKVRPESAPQPEKTSPIGWRGLLRAVEENFHRLETTSEQHAERSRQASEELRAVRARSVELRTRSDRGSRYHSSKGP